MAACFEQPEVYFNLNGMKQHASLFEGGILSRNKDINIDCLKRKISILQDGDKIIVTKNRTNDIINIDNKLIIIKFLIKYNSGCLALQLWAPKG